MNTSTPPHPGALSSASGASDMTLGFDQPSSPTAAATGGKDEQKDRTLRKTASLDALVHAALFATREVVEL